MRTKLAQLRANKSPLLQSYLKTRNLTLHATIPLCLIHTNDTNHLLNVAKSQHNTTPRFYGRSFCKKKSLDCFFKVLEVGSFKIVLEEVGQQLRFKFKKFSKLILYYYLQVKICTDLLNVTI